MLRYTLLLLALLAGALDATAASVLLVIRDSSPSSSESSRISSFQSWGHTVSTIRQDRDSSEFNTALSAADVVYIPCTIEEWELGTKVKSTTKGVVCEERYLDIEMGFSTADGWDASHNNTEVLNNSHSVTSGLSTGYVTIVSSNQPLAMMNATVAGGMTVLSKQNYAAGNMLGVIDVGGALAGGGTAAGRRVRMPWGGDSFNWSALNANGLKIAQQAIAWAVGATGPILHWKLDESSGTIAADSSTLNNTGTYTGSPTLGLAAPRVRGVNFPSDGRLITRAATASLNALGVSNADFTVAFWIRPGAPTGNWRAVFHKGSIDFERGPGIWLQPGTNQLHVCISTTASNNELFDTPTQLPADAWSHVLVMKAGSSYRCYINGKLDGSTTLSGTTTGNSGPLYVGDDPWHGGCGGSMDDVRIYNYALSNAEIAEVHGLIAHWKLNETSGATADDSSLANNDATRTGTAGWTTGNDANAHNFNYNDGDDYFQAPTNTALNDVQEGDYTVMAYFKPNSVPPGSGSANNSAYGIVRKSGWHAGLVYGSDGSIFFEHWLQSGPTWNGAGDWEFHAPNSFYHVAGVVSRTEGTIKIYVDGVLKETSSFTPGAAPYDYGSTPWRIGISNPGASEWRHAADGVIDDARIYNRALSAEEIAPFATPGLVAHWKFDEGTGTTVADAQGYHPAAFDTGAPTWIDGVRGKALQFNGSNDADTNAPLDPPGVGTLALWFRFNSAPSGTQRLLGVSDDWEIRTDATGALWADLCVGGTQNVFKTSAGTAVGGVWRHLAAVYNSNTDLYKLYLDGKLVSTGSLAMTDASAAVLSFGSRTGTSAYFNGALDDIRLYNYELSDKEVAEIYGLIGHWRFDEGTGSTVADASGAENDGAFATGSPSWVAGVRGSALSFNGSTTAATSQAFDPPATGAVALWCRFTASPTSSQRLIGLGGDWEVRADSAGTIFADLGADAVAAGFQTPAGAAVGSQWRHLIACFDADNDDFELYLDGALTASGSLAISKQAAQILSFGTRTGSTERFNGSLDDVRVYNRWLQPREIAELYGLVGHWKLDETSGGVATDSSGAGRHGTFLGSPTLGLGGPGSGSVAATFDGLDDCVSIPTVNDTFADGVTIAGWMKPIAANNYAKLMQLSVGTSLGIDLGRLGTSNDLRGIVDNGAEFAMSGALHSNVWRHYTMTMDATGSMRLYRNGALLGAAARSPVPVAVRTTNWIGASNFGGDELFEGQMHDVRLYNRPISDEEATALYLGGNVFPSVRIVKWVEVANP